MIKKLLFLFTCAHISLINSATEKPKNEMSYVVKYEKTIDFKSKTVDLHLQVPFDSPVAKEKFMLQTLAHKDEQLITTMDLWFANLIKTADRKLLFKNNQTNPLLQTYLKELGAICESFRTLKTIDLKKIEDLPEDEAKKD